MESFCSTGRVRQIQFPLFEVQTGWRGLLGQRGAGMA
jgi:hypothetical protein